MKTSNYLIGLAALTSLTLVGCSDNSFVNQVFGSSESGQGEITFGAGTKNITRAETIKHTEAAARLNNNFVLYGFKTNAEENIDGSTDEKVFDNYNVNYVEGSSNTTESNTAGWEYVGYNPAANSTATEQTIKYWDHSANQYIFSAFSGIGVTGSKTLTAETDKYDKGWTLTIPQGGSLADLYASDRVEKASDTDGEVTLTFYSAVTKIRFGVYETVPGYSINIDKFYYNNLATADDHHFAIDGTFNTLNPGAATSLKVTYYNSGTLLNHPKIDASGGTKADYMQFGTNIQAQTAIGTTSPEATYDKSEMEYTYILPYANASNVLKLKVDYTLTSTDGSGEKIKVTGATATVPANFTQWKNNFAYTYIFKISDNTNGHTGTGDVAGLYPITFDACVVNAEDGIQQTITSVSEPSITTYQKGTIVTEHDEYYANTDDIYFSVMKDAALKDDLGAKAKVFEVVNNGTEPLTENVSENYLNNFCVFTAVTATQETAVPLADGTNLTFAENTCYKFTPEAGKTYVIQYDAGDPVYYDLTGYNKAHGTNLDGTAFEALSNAEKTRISGIHYKVVKVEGTRAAFSYAWTAPTDKDISTTTEALTFTLNENSVGVLGAIPSIKIKSGTNDVTSKFKIEAGASAGEYKVSLTQAAIAENVNGTSYTIDYNNGTTSTFTVNVSYALATSPVTVVKNGTGASFTLTASGNALSKAVILNLPAGVTITESSTPGTYNVAASSKATVGTYTTTTVAGQALTIKVDSYSFSGDLVLTKPLTGDASGDITLSNSAGAFTTATVGNLGSGYDAGIASATVSNGVYTFTTVAGGSYDIAYENAKAKVTVNAYTLTSDAVSNTIARATGATNITVKCNGNVINASTASVECKAKPTSSSYSLTTNGQVLRFGNATVAGNYTFQYKIGTVVVAEITIIVN